MPFSDVYTGMQRGSLDCALVDPTTLTVGPKLAEVASDVTQIPVGIIIGASWVYNKSFWRGLPVEQRRTLMEQMKLALARMEIGYEVQGNEGFDGAKAQGVNVAEPEADLADALSKFNANFLSDLPAAAAERFKIDQPDGLLQDFIARQEAWKERLAKVDIQDQDAILGLLEPPGRIAAGSIHLSGDRIDNLSDREMQQVRGRRIGAIFQDPLTSLNPLFRVGDQLVETIRLHTDLTKAQARERAKDLMREVGIPAVEERIDNYPHQFSGGMRLGVIAETADRVAVMYAGRLAEVGAVEDVVRRPRHPYTAGLMGSIPSLRSDVEELQMIPGAMPRLDAIPPGCAFNPRCAHAGPKCRRDIPRVEGTQAVACWLATEGAVA